MTFNTLFLPLLGGFLFFHFFRGTAYQAPNQPPQTVLILSAAIGVLLLIVARCSIYFLQGIRNQIGISEWALLHLAPPLLITLMTALAVGLLLAVYEVADGGSNQHKGSKQFWNEFTQRIGRWKIFWLTSVGLTATLLLVGLAIWSSRSGKGPPILLLGALPVAAIWLARKIAKHTGLRVDALVFRMAIIGCGILIVGVLAAENLRAVTTLWNSIISPLGTEGRRGLATAFTACVLGPASATVLNWCYTRKAAATRYVLKGSASSILEKFLYRAAIDGRLVMLTTRDRKVYVGNPVSVSVPAMGRSGHLVLLPNCSGYRDKDTLEVEFTTVYSEVYANMAEHERRVFYKTLPLSDVCSAGLFDRKYFDRFRSNSNPA